MEELRNVYEILGLTHVETYVQSGNIVFDSEEENTIKLAKYIEAQIEQTFGFTTPVFIRSADDLQHIITGNPFLIRRNEDPTRLHVTFLYAFPADVRMHDVKNLNESGDEFFIQGQEIYLFCPNGYGRTKLNNNFFERKLNLPATTRNWKTVNALFDIAKRR